LPAGEFSANSKIMERREITRKVRKLKRREQEQVRAGVRLDLAQRKLAASNKVERDRALHRLAAYLEKARLLYLDYEALLGAARLLAPFERRPERMEEWKRRGEALRRREEAQGWLDPGSSRSEAPAMLDIGELRRRNHERMGKGAALDKGGIGHWEGDVIRGALALISDRAKQPGATERWRAVPAPSDDEVPLTVEIRFKGTIDPALKAEMAEHGFASEEDDRIWRMTSDIASLEARAIGRSLEPRIVSGSGNIPENLSTNPTKIECQTNIESEDKSRWKR
jgi:hypothetical protein